MNTRRWPGLVCAVTALLLLVPAVPGRAAESPPTVLWNVTSFPGNSNGSAIAIGPDGNPVVAGTVCDPWPSACTIRVIKHDANTGAVIWGVTLAPIASDGAGGVAIAADGHPLVSGTSCDPRGFHFACDFRIVKLNGATGAVLWSVTFDTGNIDAAGPIAVGPDGNPVVTGFSCLADFSGCGALTVKFSGATGAVLWSVMYPASDEGEGIAVGPDGHPVVSIFKCVGCGHVVKYDGLTGALLWDVPFNASHGGGYSGGVAFGPDGHPVVTGAAPVDVTSDFRTIKYDSATGAELWNVAFDGGEFDESAWIAIGGDGHPVVGGTSCTSDLTSCVGRTVKFDGATGALLWSFTGLSGNLATGPDGDPVVTNVVCTGEDSCDVKTVKYVIQHDTPTGAPVAVALNGGTGAADGVIVTFTTVGTAGSTTLTASATGPTPPTEFTLGAPPIFYDVATTAVFTGTVQVCINYANRSVPAPESDLTLLHFQGGSWVDVTSSNDTVARIICGQTSTLSPFLIAERTPLAVTIDIKPGSYPNTINLGSNGVVPVSIFSTATFDARTVDPTTVTLASAAVKLTGKGKPIASFQDVNGDGHLDLVVQVETSALQLTSADTVAVLRGKTFSGQPIKGSDSVRIVPQ
jgi:hypothetical protein